MIVTVLSGGSRGDVQPYVALAKGFRAAGHTARLVTLREFLPMLEGTGIESLVNEYDVRKMLDTKDGHQMVGAGQNPILFLRKFSKFLRPLIEESVQDVARFCRDTDGLVLSSMSIVAGTRGLERVGVPYCAAWPMPATPTAHMASVMFPELPAWVPFGRSLYNRLTHWTLDTLMYLLLGRLQAQAVARLPASHRAIKGAMPVLYGYSPSVVAPPPDWPESVTVTGYWFLDGQSDYQPPPALAEFLAAGAPPVYVGFGSMNDRDPKGSTQLVCKALERAERRGILITGWGGLQAGDLPKHVLGLESAPHDWLFTRAAAVVHHCGAGTTAAGLRAGVPTIGVPHFADQYFWGRRVEQLGVGPRAIPRKKLTVEKLAEALRVATTDQAMIERAKALGERIRAEDGIAVAVERAVRHFAQA